ncbi:MAG: aspartate--tRNA ligase [Candidatus Sumerlaeia bacterium]|nr:aspartate--tRNA ligase [Candidatus Sumerlaeia bacterium]
MSDDAKTDLRFQPRSCYCGELRRSHIGQRLVLKGWIHRRRDHGGLIFIDLRDREGLCQIVLNPQEMNPEKFEQAHRLRDEWVLAIEGVVRERPEGTGNPNLPTGEVEVVADRFEILNVSEPLPFKLDEYASVNEMVRLKYRYLDLRRPEMQRIIRGRAKFVGVVRRYFDSIGFIEVETPILTKSTPEGARDFLVPSRMNPGSFYALPQSPQLFKQILMVAGYDKYYQIARCFRDEDLRANRQPEFTQIDVEMSFITRDDIMRVMEGMIVAIYRELQAREVPVPFPRYSYSDVMLRYGIDKPDLRFGLEIVDLTDSVGEGCSFQVFRKVIESRGVIRGFCLPGGAAFSRKQLDDLEKFAREQGAGGLAWFKAGDDGIQSPVAKFFEPSALERLCRKAGLGEGALLLAVADKEEIVCNTLAQLRLKLGREAGLIDSNKLAFAWVTDFPLFFYNTTEKRWDPAHHPFTAPMPEDLPLLDSDPGRVRSLAYDMVLNGEEIGGGSIRIHDRETQRKVFRTIGISDEEAAIKFSFLLEALSYGAPPHGGIAMGVERMVMSLFGVDSIREVIAFPKTQSGTCVMSGAPTPVSDAQLKELFIRTIEPIKA